MSIEDIVFLVLKADVELAVAWATWSLTKSTVIVGS